MAKNVYDPQMAKNVYGPAMAKNIYGPPMAQNTYSSYYSQYLCSLCVIQDSNNLNQDKFWQQQH